MWLSSAPLCNICGSVWERVKSRCIKKVKNNRLWVEPVMRREHGVCFWEERGALHHVRFGAGQEVFDLRCKWRDESRGMSAMPVHGNGTVKGAVVSVSVMLTLQTRCIALLTTGSNTQCCNFTLTEISRNSWEQEGWWRRTRRGSSSGWLSRSWRDPPKFRWRNHRPIKLDSMDEWRVVWNSIQMLEMLTFQKQTSPWQNLVCEAQWWRHHAQIFSSPLGCFSDQFSLHS